MRTFVAVYQERSFTSAAKRLNATQSGLSMQVKELEDSLGIELFNRTSAGVNPTAAGEHFYRRSIDILRDLSNTEEEMRGMGEQLSGRVVVGLMPTFSRSVLPSVLKDFTQAHPYVDLKVFEAYSGVLTKAVVAGEADFAIVPKDKSSEGLEVRHVANDREILVTNIQTSRQNLDPVTLRDVGPLKLILPTIGNSRRKSLDSYLANVGANVESVIELDGMMGTLDTIAESDWVAVLPGTLCIPDVSGERRKLHPVVDPILTVEYFFIQSEVRSLNPAAHAIAEALILDINRVCGEVEARITGQ